MISIANPFLILQFFIASKSVDWGTFSKIKFFSFKKGYLGERRAPSRKILRLLQTPARRDIFE